MERTLEKMVGGARAAVLRALEGGKRSVGEIVTITGLSQPNVSNHLGRLRQLGLVHAQRAGKRVYYTIVSPDLVRALLSSPADKPLPNGVRAAMASETLKAFDDAVLAGDHESARSTIDRALSAGLPWQDIYTGVFAPVMVKIGDMWEAGTWTIAEEHAASNLIQRLISHVASLRIPTQRTGPSDVVVACAEGELHDIGARMTADFLAAENLNVVFLGGNIPTDALLSAVSRLKPAALCVSASTDDRIPVLRELAQRLADLPPNCPVPVLFLGGRLMGRRPELAAELGARTAPEGPGELAAAIRSIS